MANEQMRRRVEMLLNGDLNSQHLDRLFLYARGCCDGRESVREVGDFVAHNSEKKKGIVTTTARDFFVMLRFNVQYIFYNKQIDLIDLPSEFIDFAEVMSRRLSYTIITRDTKLKGVKFRKLLQPLLEKFKSKGNGRLTLSSPISTLEEHTKMPDRQSYS
jgi:hypothetical protein